MLEGILYVCLARWDTICVICHNGIVHSHQLCSVENAFTYIFKGFCCLRFMLHSLVIAIYSWLVVAFVSDSDIQLACHSG